MSRTSPTHPFVLGYYPEWNTNLAPAAIDFSLFTHICHAFAVVYKDGTLMLPDGRQSHDLCAHAHERGVQVLLSVGGADSGPAFSAQTTDGEGAVARLADRLVKSMRQVGYDGLDVDWEFPANATESKRMCAFVRAVRERLPHGATLTMATPATNWNGQWFDVAALLSALDFVNVMTYDFHGDWSERSGYNAPLYASPDDPDTRADDTVSGAIDYWLQQKRWPAEKLLLGIPLYGRGFRATHWGDRPSGTFAGAEDLTYNVIQGLARQGWHRKTDAIAKTPTLRSPDGTKLISYDDADSATIKGAYAKSHKLGGIFFWDISNDFDGKSNPLVRAARKGLL